MQDTSNNICPLVLRPGRSTKAVNYYIELASGMTRRRPTDTTLHRPKRRFRLIPTYGTATPPKIEEEVAEAEEGRADQGRVASCLQSRCTGLLESEKAKSLTEEPLKDNAHLASF